MESHTDCPMPHMNLTEVTNAGTLVMRVVLAFIKFFAAPASPCVALLLPVTLGRTAQSFNQWNHPTQASNKSFMDIPCLWAYSLGFFWISIRQSHVYFPLMFISQYQNFSSPQSWVNAYPSLLCIMRGKAFSWSLVVFFLVLKCRGPFILRKVSISPGCWTHASSLNLPPLRPCPDDAPPPCSALGPLPSPDQCFSRCALDMHSTCPGGLLSTWLPPAGLRRLRISQS